MQEDEYEPEEKTFVVTMLIPITIRAATMSEAEDLALEELTEDPEKYAHHGNIDTLRQVEEE